MASLLCYVFGKYACKICIQHLSFALPLTLAVPLTMAILATVNPCFFNNPFFGSLEFVTPTGNYFTANVFQITRFLIIRDYKHQYEFI